MEVFGMMFAMVFFPAVVAFWLHLSKKYSALRRFRIAGVALILLPAVLGAVSMSWWMFTQEPLYSAAGYGDKARVEALLKRGADINAETDEGDTALNMAAANGRVEMVNFLLGHGANVNGCDRRRGWVPLESAAANGHTDVVRILLAHGADVNVRNTWNNSTPLMSAEKNGHQEIVEMLRKAGAK